MSHAHKFWSLAIVPITWSLHSFALLVQAHGLCSLPWTTLMPILTWLFCSRSQWPWSGSHGSSGGPGNRQLRYWEQHGRLADKSGGSLLVRRVQSGVGNFNFDRLGIFVDDLVVGRYPK